MDAFMVWDFYEGGNLKYFFVAPSSQNHWKQARFLYIRLEPESIEWFIEYQAFSSSYDVAPPLPPLSRHKARPATQRNKERQLAHGRGGEEQNYMTARKSGTVYTVHYSILSDLNRCSWFQFSN
jgi:hypothetical protein